MRYQNSMDLENVMIDIREDLRKQLKENTTLKIEEVDFMEEKLVENLTMLCEIINGEYISAAKSQNGRFEVVMKASTLNYPGLVYVSRIII